jgi:hypothetical protein
MSPYGSLMIQSLQSVDDQLHYRVAIVLPHSKEILAESDGDSRRLPTIMIQRWSRIAEQITTNIKDRWSLQTVVIDSLAASGDTPGLAILEALSCDPVSKETLQPCLPDDIWIDQQHRTLIQAVLSGTDKCRNPLLRLGWIDEAKQWLQANNTDRKIQFNDEICQLNAGAGFALIRLGVFDGPAYWIKAVGPPNRHEAAITETLSKCSPASLPPLVAVHRTWNAWAMEEVGTALTDSVDAETISLVSLSLARLQQQTISHTKTFLNCGCGDQRIETLRRYLPEFLDDVARLISETAFEDSGHDITTIHPRIEHTLRIALEEMGQLGIPDTINNNDMKLANILFDGRRCAFIDWCHAYWGNPFLTFQHMHIYLSRRLSALSRPFQEAYAEAWAAHLSESQIEEALALTPIVAPYAYLCAWGSTSLVSRVTAPDTRKVFVKIVRRILAAGEQLSRKERSAYV